MAITFSSVNSAYYVSFVRVCAVPFKRVDKIQHTSFIDSNSKIVAYRKLIVFTNLFKGLYAKAFQVPVCQSKDLVPELEG